MNGLRLRIHAQSFAQFLMILRSQLRPARFLPQVPPPNRQVKPARALDPRISFIPRRQNSCAPLQRIPAHLATLTLRRTKCPSFRELVGSYSIFGNTVDRKHRFKSARPQGATTWRESPKGHTISENAVRGAGPRSPGKRGPQGTICVPWGVGTGLRPWGHRAPHGAGGSRLFFLTPTADSEFLKGNLMRSSGFFLPGSPRTRGPQEAVFASWGGWTDFGSAGWK
jgi:hypothetical protein